MSFDGTLGENSADVRLDAGNGSIRIGRPTDLSNQSFWAIEDTVSPVTSDFSTIPKVAGTTVFVAMSIDLNSNPAWTTQ